MAQDRLHVGAVRALRGNDRPPDSRHSPGTEDLPNLVPRLVQEAGHRIREFALGYTQGCTPSCVRSRCAHADATGHKGDPTQWTLQHARCDRLELLKEQNRVTNASRIRGTRRTRKDTRGLGGASDQVQGDTQGNAGTLRTRLTAGSGASGPGFESRAPDFVRPNFPYLNFPPIDTSSSRVGTDLLH